MTERVQIMKKIFSQRVFCSSGSAYSIASTYIVDATSSCPAFSQADNDAIFPSPKTALPPFGGTEPFQVYGLPEHCVLNLSRNVRSAVMARTFTLVRPGAGQTTTLPAPALAP